MGIYRNLKEILDFLFTYTLSYWKSLYLWKFRNGQFWKSVNILCELFHPSNRVPRMLYLFWVMFIAFPTALNQDFIIFCFWTGFWWRFCRKLISNRDPNLAKSGSKLLLNHFWPDLGPDLRLVSAKTSPKTSPEAKNDKIPILARWKCYKHVPNQI